MFQISTPCFLKFSLKKNGIFQKAMLFREQSIASLPEKQCFARNEEMAYTFFNFLSVSKMGS